MKKKALAILLLTCTIGFTGCATQDENNNREVKEEIAVNVTAERKNVGEKETKDNDTESDGLRGILAKIGIGENKDNNDVENIGDKTDIDDIKEIDDNKNIDDSRKADDNKNVDDEKVISGNKEDNKKNDETKKSDDENMHTEIVDTKISFCRKGYRYELPSDITCFYQEGYGPIICKENEFQLLMDPTDKEFDAVKFTLETSNDYNSALVDAPILDEIFGVEVIYYVVNDGGKEILCVISEIEDNGCCMTGQIKMLSDELEIRDYVKSYIRVVTAVSATEDEDTTEEELRAEVMEKENNKKLVNEEKTRETEERINNELNEKDPTSTVSEKEEKTIYGERIESTTLTFDKKKVSLKVPEGFLFKHDVSDQYSSVQFFESQDFEAYIELEKLDDVMSCFFGMDETTEIKKCDINGRTVYYATEIYQYGDLAYEMLVCACDLGNGYCYIVEADNCDGYPLSVESVKEFFDITE